ncbi:MAG TPA: MFS transporter [Pseudonocardiaceae bacterium]|nr:MFS transporter [Pseudonocardiaceae bacterium]
MATSTMNRRLLGARLAVYTVFAANGALFGSWAPRIPEVKADLHMSAAVLGVVLLAPAIGSLVAMPFAGGLAGRIGSARATRLAAVPFFLAMSLVGVAGSAPALFVALLAWGTSIGVLDVVMNAQAVTVERAWGRSLMSGFHATFSLGALAGTGMGGAASVLGVGVGVQLLGLGATLLALVLATSLWMLPDRLAGDGERPPLLVRPHGPLVAVTVAAFAVLLCEGAAADWSAVYLRDDLGSSAALAGAAFAAFSATMTAGRLIGDRVLNRWPRRVVVRAFAGAAGIGFGAGLTVAELAGDGTLAVVAAVSGFAVLGAGISLTFPALLAEAASVAPRPAEGIGAVATGGYLGFLVGPPMIGGLAELTSLPVALWLLPLLAVAAAVLIRPVKGDQRRRPTMPVS